MWKKHFQIRPAVPGAKTRQKNSQENYRPIFLICTDAKVLSETLANQIQEHITMIILHDKVEFIPGDGKVNLYMKIK